MYNTDTLEFRETFKDFELTFRILSLVLFRLISHAYNDTFVSFFLTWLTMQKNYQCNQQFDISYPSVHSFQLNFSTQMKWDEMS